MRALAAVTLLVLAALPAPSSAHLAGGRDVVVDGYIVDFGHEPAPPVAGEPAALAFNLVDKETMAPVEPESVWVRISTDRDILFAGVLKPEPATVTFSYAFPAAGAYEIKARFSFGREEVIEVQVPLEVVAPPEDGAAGPARRSGGWAVAAVILAVGALFLVSTRRKAPAHTSHH
jgi:hypothetical protein